MRVLVVGRHHGGQVRGANVATCGLARALAAAGHRVTLLQCAEPEHRVELAGVSTRYFRTRRKSVQPWLYAGASLRGRFDLIHANDQSAAALALLARAGGTPAVAQINAPHVSHEDFWRSGWRWRYIGVATRYAPLVLTPSGWLADALAQRYGRSRDDFRVVPYGVGAQWFYAGDGAHPPGPGLRVALVNMKGVEIALRAFASAAAGRDATLELYGTHRHEENYRQLARDLGIAQRTRFCGFVPNGELPKRLAGADVLVHPTAAESFGQVLAEAAALGIPAISSHVSAVPEVVEDGVSGLLCPPGNVQAFGRALERLLDDSPLRARLGQSARRRALALWRWEVVVARLEQEVYAPLIGG